MRHGHVVLLRIGMTVAENPSRGTQHLVKKWLTWTPLPRKLARCLIESHAVKLCDVGES